MSILLFAAIVKLLSGWKKAAPVEHRTPSGRLCPFAGMSDADLDDFEDWAERTDGVPRLYPRIT